MKVCTKCEQAKPESAFARDRSRADGLTYRCRECRNRRSRELHRPVVMRRKPGPEPIAERDGDARQARRTVNHLVETGRIPHPNGLPCSDCGHEWEPGERRHEYDHYLGYGSGHHRAVEPVCTTCHHRRERERLQEVA